MSHFKLLPTSPIVPVPVLVVYPAENPAFQRGVVALAEFLQWHGGCSVAVDMWQQRKIAELGPMRWLAEQAKAAARVLIVCPQVEIVSCLGNLFCSAWFGLILGMMYFLICLIKVTWISAY